MTLKLTGLQGKALRARASLDAIGKAYDAFNSDALAHLADVKSIASDLTEMQDDLGAATRILGNSVNGSEAPVQPLSPQTAVPEPPVTQIAPAPAASPPAVGIATNFPQS